MMLRHVSQSQSVNQWQRTNTELARMCPMCPNESSTLKRQNMAFKCQLIAPSSSGTARVGDVRSVLKVKVGKDDDENNGE
jgi:hypothetical protein